MITVRRHPVWTGRARKRCKGTGEGNERLEAIDDVATGGETFAAGEPHPALAVFNDGLLICIVGGEIHVMISWNHVPPRILKRRHCRQRLDNPLAEKGVFRLLCLAGDVAGYSNYIDGLIFDILREGVDKSCYAFFLIR